MAPVEIEDAASPAKLKAPEVEVRLRAPVVKVKPFEAVKVWDEVNEPALVVKMPLAPMLIAEVLAVPNEIVPLVEVPDPALMVTEPPVEVAPDSLPASNTNAPPVAESVVFVAGWTVSELPPVRVVISGDRFPAKASCPNSLMVKVLAPACWISKLVLVAPLVSLMIKAGAVPAFVRVKDVAVPELEDSS